jgi:hypothetical protein
LLSDSNYGVAEPWYGSLVCVFIMTFPYCPFSDKFYRESH